MKATSRGRRAIYLTLTAACALSAETAAAAAEKVPLPRPRPVIINVGTRLATPAAITPATAPVPSTVPLPQKRPPANTGLSSFAQANVGVHGAIFESRAFFKPLARPASGPFAIAPTAATSEADIAAVKRVIEAARKGTAPDA